MTKKLMRQPLTEIEINTPPNEGIDEADRGEDTAANESNDITTEVDTQSEEDIPAGALQRYAGP